MSTNELALADTMYLMPAMKIESVIERRNTMVKFVEAAMKKDTDFGIIPGTGSKPTLYKPGAEKLCTLFALAPRFKIIERREDWTGADHGGEPFFFYHLKCELYYRGEVFVGEADGSCNSFEKKYRYRKAERVCPLCGKDAIKKSKFPPRNDPTAKPGWYCYDKAGGCGANFPAGDPQIENQEVGQVANPDVADQVNTILKMAQKRALVAATLIAVNASEFFTQDIEDMLIDGDYRVLQQTESPKPEQPAPPPGYVAPAEKVHVPSHDNGNGAAKPTRPYSLDLLRRAIIARAEKTYAGRTISAGHRGQIIGALDALLGGSTDKRHEFLFAVTGHKSSKDIADNYMESLWDWVNGDLDTIRAEANNALVESLKAQGQTELPQI